MYHTCDILRAAAAAALPASWVAHGAIAGNAGHLLRGMAEGLVCGHTVLVPTYHVCVCVESHQHCLVPGL